jgi:hypothetical protein
MVFFTLSFFALICSQITLKMKKNILKIALILFSANAMAQNVPVNFESGGNGASWTWTVFENDDNPAVEIIDNPDKTGANTSDKVAKFTVRKAGQLWAGCETKHGQDIGTFTLTSANSTIKIMVWKNVISDVGIKLVDATNGSLGEIKVANTKTGVWEELVFDFSSREGIPYDQIVVFPDFGARTADNIVYFDNISFGAGTPPPSPMTAAPAPTVPAANVISLFSDSYTNVPVNTWRTDWSNAVFAEVDIQGNKTIKYSALDFVGVETVGANIINATDMMYVHFDMWTADATTFRIKIVDYGDNGVNGGGDDKEHEYVITNPTKETWNSKAILLSDFTNLTNKAHIAQIIFSALPVGKSTVYLDNIFFSKGGGASANTASNVKVNVYPNPANDQLTINLNSNASIEQIQLVDLQGKVVYTETVNTVDYNKTISTSQFGAGIYFLKVIAANEVVNHKVVIK